MKKAISMILVLILSLSLCACSVPDDASISLSDSQGSLIGEWSSTDQGGFVLLSSGKVILTSSLSNAADGTYNPPSGTWEVENGYLILFTENYNAYQSAQVYRILSDTTVERNGITYRKS